MIIHADMDAFFASVEIREQPALRGKPVVVGGRPDQRGVVAAASYAARQYGIRSAMAMAAALQRCPDLIILPGRLALYREVSQQIHAIFSRYTPLIEPLSLDEAFLDVTASTALFGSATEIAQRIKQAVRDELDLVVSMGVAPTKFVAKIASDLDKPDGFVVVEPEAVQGFLDPLPVSRLWGVGKVTGQQLIAHGIHTIADLRQAPAPFISQRFGKHGEHLRRLAQGIDPRPVTPDHQAKSLSHETTFAQDVTDPDTLRAVLLSLTEQVAWRARRHDLLGRTVQLKLRYDNFHTITRAHSLRQATNTTRELWDAVRRLLNLELATRLPPIRLIGMGISGFDRDDSQLQMGLFEPSQSTSEGVDQLTDAINSRFGDKLVSRARGIRQGSTTPPRSET